MLRSEAAAEAAQVISCHIAGERAHRGWPPGHIVADAMVAHPVNLWMRFTSLHFTAGSPDRPLPGAGRLCWQR